MASNVQDLRPKPPETEKITINLGYVDLGHVDLMVKDGFYSNRTDFIRTAIRNQIERHAEVVKQSTARKGLDLGLRNYTRADLEAWEKKSGVKVGPETSSCCTSAVGSVARKWGRGPAR